MKIKELATNYGSEDLLIAAIMRERACSEEEARDYYWQIMFELDLLMNSDR